MNIYTIRKNVVYPASFSRTMALKHFHITRMFLHANIQSGLPFFSSVSASVFFFFFFSSFIFFFSFCCCRFCFCVCCVCLCFAHMPIHWKSSKTSTYRTKPKSMLKRKIVLWCTKCKMRNMVSNGADVSTLLRMYVWICICIIVPSKACGTIWHKLSLLIASNGCESLRPIEGHWRDIFSKTMPAPSIQFSFIWYGKLTMQFVFFFIG